MYDKTYATSITVIRDYLFYATCIYIDNVMYVCASSRWREDKRTCAYENSHEKYTQRGDRDRHDWTIKIWHVDI